MPKEIKNIEVEHRIYKNIKSIIEVAKKQVTKAINFAMVDAYWNVGKMIVEEEQSGEYRANYGEMILKDLSRRLTIEFGRGFSVTNLKNMRKFYITFSISQTLSDQLSWSHYLLLTKVKEDDKRLFYFNEAMNSKWSVRELERQISSLLFERLTLSKDKEEVLLIAKEGHEINSSKDLVKDPYVLEFLNLKPNIALYEKDLENALIEHLQEFLLELGKGFSFVSRSPLVKLSSKPSITLIL